LPDKGALFFLRHWILFLVLTAALLGVGCSDERRDEKGKPGCTTPERFAAFGANVLFVVIRARKR
jgi:hypothetical protein